MESFSWLCGNPHCKEVSPLYCMRAALSGAAPVDQVSHNVYVAVLAGEGCINSGHLFFTGSLVHFL